MSDPMSEWFCARCVIFGQALGIYRLFCKLNKVFLMDFRFLERFSIHLNARILFSKQISRKKSCKSDFRNFWSDWSLLNMISRSKASKSEHKKQKDQLHGQFIPRKAWKPLDRTNQKVKHSQRNRLVSMIRRWEKRNEKSTFGCGSSFSLL